MTNQSKKNEKPKILTPGLINKLQLFVTGSLMLSMVGGARQVARALTVPTGSADPTASLKQASEPSEAITQKMLKQAKEGAIFKPRVIEFSAEWCEPCKRLSDVMQQAKEKYGDSVEFMTLDIDDPVNAGMVEKYQVEAVPAVFYVGRTGVVINNTVGYSGPRAFYDAVDEMVEKDKKTYTSHAN